MTELNAKDLIWREWTARRILGGDTTATASELVRQPWPHTAAEYWSGDKSAATPMNAGWLYYDQSAVLFIGDSPIRVLTDRPRTNEDRLMHLPYSQIGAGQIRKAHNRKERLLKFSDGTVFLMPKRYAKKIASLANQ